MVVVAVTTDWLSISVLDPQLCVEKVSCGLCTTPLQRQIRRDLSDNLS